MKNIWFDPCNFFFAVPGDFLKFFVYILNIAIIISDNYGVSAMLNSSSKFINDYFVPTDIGSSISFEDFLWKTADLYQKDERLFSPLGSKCKSCSYKANIGDNSGLKSGFNECWQHATGLKSLNKPLVTELWFGLVGNRSFVDELVI